eukprot:7791830-Ditylum_brightwellii.AAC.1
MASQSKATCPEQHVTNNNIWRANAILACSCRVPSSIYIDERHQKRELHRMVGLVSRKCPQPCTKVTQNKPRTHQEEKKNKQSTKHVQTEDENLDTDPI